MSIALPENLKSAVNKCTNFIDTYVKAPGLYLGKTFFYIMSPRQISKGEQTVVYIAKELVVFIAKIIIGVACATFLKATMSFSIYFSVGVFMFGAARYVQIYKNKLSIAESIHNICLSAYILFQNLTNLKTV